jgi:phage gpG-like protein
MFNLDAVVNNDIMKLADKMEKANFKNIKHAAASLRLRAIALIEKSPSPSQPGRPIHTRKGRARGAILFKADEHSAIIGPRYSRFRTIGKAHEFGGSFQLPGYNERANYPARPFMGPALVESSSRFAAEWSNSIGG